MKICVKDQIRNPALPLKCVTTLTGSALALEIYGVPAYMAGGEVTALSVSVTNADGSVITGAATQDGTDWHVLFAASNFASYGTVRFGVVISATITTDSSEYTVKVAVGDFEVVQASASATPGDVSKTYQTLGGDEYLKTTVIDDVQHYTKLTMVNNTELGWVLDTDGDYVLVDGEFVAAE